MKRISYPTLVFILAANFILFGFFLNEIRVFTENKETELASIINFEPKLKESEDSGITIFAVGDIMLDRGVKYQMRKQEDFRWPFLRLANSLKGADLLFGNLEGPISDKGIKVGSIFSFRAEPKAKEGLAFAGFDILSLANNHLLDYQDIALEETMRILQENNIDYVGAGRNREEAFSLKVKEVKGTKIGFLAYTNLGPQSWQAGEDNPGIAWIQEEDIEKLKTDINEAKQKVDVLVVSLHSGEEYSSEPSSFQFAFSRAMIEAGADLVVGHHPHIIQKVEKYKQGWIAYSLGNFVFDQSFSEETMRGLLLEVVIKDKKINQVIQKEIKISDSLQPYFSEAQEILKGLTLEQKIGQLFMVGFEGTVLTSELKDLIQEIHPGGVLLLKRNIENEKQLKNLIDDLQKIALEDTGLPLFVAVDQEGGPMCRIEWLEEKTSQSEIKNDKQAYQVGLSRGRKLKNLGVNLNLAPVLDAASLGDFIFNRTFQKDAASTGILAKNIILGQKEAGILTAIKHFPGYGDISFNPETVMVPVLPKMPEISQFQKALEAKPEFVMTSNVVYKEINRRLPFVFSEAGVQFLKGALSGDYLIISDDLSSETLKKEFSLKNSVLLALKAGVDILLVAGFDQPQDVERAFFFLLEEAKKGRISEEKIDQSVLKIIALKSGLMDRFKLK